MVETSEFKFNKLKDLKISELRCDKITSGWGNELLQIEVLNIFNSYYIKKKLVNKLVRIYRKRNNFF